MTREKLLNLEQAGYSRPLTHIVMGTKYSCLGVVWVIMSFITMGVCAVGFVFPFWLEGTMPANGNSATYLGVFRRCNYPRLTENGQTEFVEECGRYRTFYDIPNMWWQIGTVSASVGCILLLLVSFLGLFACCVRDVLSFTMAKVAGILQFLAGLCVGTCCLLYPLGWESLEVRQVCGTEADLYHLGHCTIGWAYYLTIGGCGLTFLCSLFSCHAVRHKYTGL